MNTYIQFFGNEGKNRTSTHCYKYRISFVVKPPALKIYKFQKWYCRFKRVSFPEIVLGRLPNTTKEAACRPSVRHAYSIVWSKFHKIYRRIHRKTGAGISST